MCNEIVFEGSQAYLVTNDKPDTRKKIRLASELMGITMADAEQKKLAHYLTQTEIPLLVIQGRAGTGKNFVTLLGALALLKEKLFSRVVYTKPLVSASRSRFLGTLPGTLEEKVQPFLESFFDVAEAADCLGTVERYLSDGVITFVPIDFMRGRSFENTLIIADEVQNLNRHELLTLTSRTGKGSRLLLLGDPSEAQRDVSDGGAFLRLVESPKFVASSLTASVSLTKCMRSPIVELCSDILSCMNAES